VSRDIFNQIRLLRDLSNLALNVSRDGAFTTSLDNPFQCFTTPMVKNFFLIASLNLPSFSFKPPSFVLSQQALLKSPSPSSSQAPFGQWKAAIRSPCSLLQAEQAQLSQPFLTERCSSPRIIFVASSGPTPTAPCPSCAESSRAGHRTPGGLSPEQSRGAKYFFPFSNHQGLHLTATSFQISLREGISNKIYREISKCLSVGAPQVIWWVSLSVLGH